MFLFCLRTPVRGHHPHHAPLSYTLTVSFPPPCPWRVAPHTRLGVGKTWAKPSSTQGSPPRHLPLVLPVSWRPCASFPDPAHASLVTLLPGRTAWCGGLAPGAWCGGPFHPPLVAWRRLAVPSLRPRPTPPRRRPPARCTSPRPRRGHKQHHCTPLAAARRTRPSSLWWKALGCSVPPLPPQSRPPPFLPCTGPPPSYLPRVRAGGTPAPFLTRTRPHNSCVQARPPGGFVAAKQIERTRLTHVPPPPPTNTASKQASNNQPCGEQRTPCKQCKQLRER